MRPPAPNTPTRIMAEGYLRSMTSPFEDARADLAAWRSDVASASDQELAALIDATITDDERRRALNARVDEFRAALRDHIAPAVAQFERRGRVPELVKYDGIGRR